MKRKLVQHGQKTLMVSLPAKWLKMQELKKGDEVVITPEEKTIIVSKDELTEAVQKLSIDVKPENRRHVRYLLGNAYKLGYDEISIQFEGEEQIKLLKAITRRMIGFEIVSLAKNFYVIKSVIKSSIEEYDNIKKRAWHNIKSGFDILLSDMAANKYANEELIIEMLDNVLKFSDFCRRLINKHKFLDTRTACLEYNVLSRLAQTMAFILNAYGYLAKNKVKADRQMLNFTKEVFALIDLAYDAYYKKGPSMGEKVLKSVESLDKKSFALFKKPAYSYLVHQLMQITTNCHRITSNAVALSFLDLFKEKH